MDSLVRTRSTDRFTAARAAFRTLMVHVPADPKAHSHLRSAARLARRLDATLAGIGAEMIDPIVFSSGYAPGAVGVFNLEHLCASNLRRAEEAFRAAAQGLDSEWSTVEDEPAFAMAHAARGADLIVTSGRMHFGETSYSACDPADLLLKSGRPILVAPQGEAELRADTVIVAWKDSREARRALSDSLPFLQAAREVLVLEVCPQEEVEIANAHTAAVAKFLARHEVNARAKVTVAAPDTVTVVLDAAAADLGADLIVAGGYGHSRLGEWILGGVTRDLLRWSPNFLLLSH